MATGETTRESEKLPEPLEEARYGPVRVLYGARGGRYPDGNSLLVEGERERLLIDPALGAITRAGELGRIDRIWNSHCHEDHIAGNHLFPDVPWCLHPLDLPGLTSLDAMMEIYGFDSEIDPFFRRLLVERFHYAPRPDPTPIKEGSVLDLGGALLRVLHTPGHTRGHCCFEITWHETGSARRLLYLGDIELTSFGPYYGDAWSSLADFERSLSRVRAIEADWYATFHHIGVLTGRAAFEARLDRFEAKIAEREQRLIAFLCEPHSLAEVVEHRFVYRRGDDVGFADSVERRSMTQHIERLLLRGVLRALADGRYVATAPPLASN